MPKALTDFSDERHKGRCCHCGISLLSSVTNRDHVPSKSLLIRPYPADLAITEICEKCNTSFSSDEEYFAAFISAVLTGHVEPDGQKLEIGRRIFERNAALQNLIAVSRRKELLDGKEQIIWQPDFARIHNVVVKNARGHAFFENGEPMFDEPAAIIVEPMALMTADREIDFFGISGSLAVWPEVGSRWMQRLVEDGDFDKDGFLVIQPGTYRFRLEVGPGIAVHSVIHEFLCASVYWFDDNGDEIDEF